MSASEIGWPEARRAASILFGPSGPAKLCEAGWRAELKRVFRERALHAHPDRAAVLGRSAAGLAREFRALNEALELLQRFDGAAPTRPEATAAPPRPAPPPTPAPPPGAARARSTPQASESVTPRRGSAAWRVQRQGEPRLPERRLRLVELLHHLGLIRSSDVGAAVAWQRAQRPSVGRLAQQFGFLDHAQVAAILAERLRAGPEAGRFATFAVARGQLTPFQRLVLLGQQRRQQRPIGAFFLERGLCTEAQLHALCERLLRHNLRHAA